MPELKILECQDCGLVTLSSLEHIQAGHYENSGMHEETPKSMESWLRETELDDQRRFNLLRSVIPNKKVLDFGCGNGGFLNKAKNLATEVVGIELEKRVQEFWQGQLEIVPDLKNAEGGVSLITAFHVVEHLPDPRAILLNLANVLTTDGRMVIEVPSSDDALLMLYECDAFRKYTYWSNHLFLFNSSTLKTLALQAELQVVSIQQYQRYPLSNHLHWLSHGKPGGHEKWSFLDSSRLNEAYAASLASVGKCDTLIAWLEKA